MAKTVKQEQLEAQLEELLSDANPVKLAKFFQKFNDMDELAIKCIMWGHTFMPSYFNKETPQFHYELVKKFFSYKNEYTACPRGFGKTTLVQLCIAFSCVVGLDEFIVVIEKSATEAGEVLEALRETFKDSDNVLEVYGDLTKISPRLKISSKMKDTTGDFIVNGVRLRGKGYDTPIRGLKSRHTRPTRIILDDVESDEHIENPDQRLKYLQNYTRGIIPATENEVGTIKMFGTILHDDSLLQTLINSHEGMIYRAWDNQRRLLWASNWTVEKLEQKRRDMSIEGRSDAAFYQEYFNEPVSEEDQIFKREMFRYFNDLQLDNVLLKKPHKFYIVVDPAISKKETADFTAIMCVLVNTKNEMYIAEMIRERLSPVETIKELFGMYERWLPEKVGIETVAYQKSLVYFIEEEKKRSHSTVSSMRIQEIKADTDKERKIKGLQPRYAIGSVYHRENDENTRVLEGELLRFPRGSTDDLIDALASVIQMVTPARKPVTETYTKWDKVREGNSHVSY
jgi:predicted phage terminase large subunit-like protein